MSDNYRRVLVIYADPTAVVNIGVVRYKLIIIPSAIICMHRRIIVMKYIRLLLNLCRINFFKFYIKKVKLQPRMNGECILGRDRKTVDGDLCTALTLLQ